MKKIVFFLFVVVFSLSAWGDTDYSRDGITATYSGTVLTISVGTTGVMPNYTYNSAEVSIKAPWSAAMSAITEVKINEGITYIGKDAFRGASKLAKITLPTSLDSVGENAFYGCTQMANLYYKGTPAQWACVGFNVQKSHPFGASTASNRKYYFYGLTTTNTIIFIEPTISTIKKWTFYGATNFESIVIPGTVNNIGTHAFDCSITSSGSILINRSTAPTLGTNAIPALTGRTLYVPSTNSGYNSSPWSSYTKSTCSTSGTTTTDGITYDWSINSEGLLTIIPISGPKELTFNLAGDSYPWKMFRRMVYKIKIQGELTAIGYLLRYHYGLSEVVLDQEAIPTVQSGYIGGTNYGSLFNKRDKLTLRVKHTTLESADEVVRLNDAPWNNEHWKINAVIPDNMTNCTSLSTIHDNLTTNFSMEIGRALSSSYYNTFCSPVSMSKTDLCADGADIRELTSTSYDASTNTLTLNFSNPLDDIVAGHAYLVKPASDVTNPTISDITPSTVVSDADNDFVITGTPASYITAHGILAPYTPTTEEYGKTFLFLMANNKLTWASSGTLNGMRAFFKVSDGAPEGLKKAAAIMRMPNVTTGIDEVYVTPGENSGENTTLGTNVQKIMRDGQLLIIRDGKTYNAVGQMIQ